MKLRSITVSGSNKIQSTKQFSDIPSELDNAIEDFSVGLSNIAAIMGMLHGPADRALAGPVKPTKQVASLSSVIATSSKEVFDRLMGYIDDVTDKCILIEHYVANNVLMKRAIFDESRLSIDDSSYLVQRRINSGQRLMNISEAHKSAYYETLKVMHAFRGLVLRFNEAVKSYNKLHSTNLATAKTSFKFFKMQVDL
jgi:hypothetical protein